MDNILVLDNVCKFVKEKKILNGISFEIGKGEIVGLVGLNGSGKTTLFKTILGLSSYSGEIIVDGNFPSEEVHNIGFMIENASLYNDMSAYDNLKFWGKFNGVSERRVNEVIKMIGLNNDKMKVKNFSLGMKQRLSFGISILDKPKLLLLDEPVNALDLVGISDMRKILLSMKDTTIIIASHDVDLLSRICNKIILISEGVVKEIINRVNFSDNICEYLLERIKE